MKHTLDVYAVQKYPEDLYKALGHLKKGARDVILFSNTKCHLQLGSQHIHSRQFDSFLCSEESGIVILLMRDGEVSMTEVMDYLDKVNTPYTEVTFEKNQDLYKNDYNVKEMWFARDLKGIESGLKDSKERHSHGADYYPYLPGYLDLSYTMSISEEETSIYGRVFKGLIETDDKIINIICDEGIEISPKKVCQLLKRNGFSTSIHLQGEPEIMEDKEKVMVLE